MKPGTIALLGFDEDCVSFEVTGLTAYRLAQIMGDPFGYEPGDRTKAVVIVTLFREDLTHAAKEGRFEEGERTTDPRYPEQGDQEDLFQPSDEREALSSNSGR